MDYSEKLKDPRWQKKRLKILERDEFTCQICFDSKSTIHIHHRRYVVGKDPWEIPDRALVSLCEICHESEQDMIKDACACLVEIIRERFLSESIFEITEGFHQMTQFCTQDAVASALKLFLTDDEAQRKMIKDFFKDCKRQAALKTAEK